MLKVTMIQPSRMLSANTKDEFLHEVDRNLDASNTTILVNLGNVLFIDSSGLGALVIALKRVRQVKGRLALCGLNEQAKMLLEQTGMEHAFEVHPTPQAFEQAIAE
jgi:anti-anti-sigma factor